jgi:phospholipase/carboxylesterase
MTLAGMNYALVNAPDEYYDGCSWFDFPGDAKPGIVRSYKLLVELLDEFRKCGFPTELTTLGGFSQGCLMSIEVGLRYPHRFAGIVGISGRASDPDQLVEQLSPVAMLQRFFISHGVFDPVIPFAEACEHAKVLKAAGLQIEWHELAKAHTIAGEQEIEMIREFVRRGYVQP